MSRRQEILPWILGILASIGLITWAAPHETGHWWGTGLVALAPLLALTIRLPRRAGILTNLVVWYSVGILVLRPDWQSVHWLSRTELVGGILMLGILPLVLTALVVLSVTVSQYYPLGIRPLALAAVWTGLEVGLAYLQWPLPLPWSLTLFDGVWLIQIADVVGSWGVTFWTITVNATFAYLLCLPLSGSQRRHLLGIGLGLSSLVGVYGAVWMSSGTAFLNPPPTPPVQLTIGSVQPIAWLESDRTSALFNRYLQRILTLSDPLIAQGSHLLIWPENALRSRFIQTPLEQFIFNHWSASDWQGNLLTGATEPVDPDTAMPLHNSALLYRQDGILLGRYDKHWIFPFFESQRYQPGRESKPLVGSWGVIGSLICLESVLPEPSRHQVLQGAELLVTIADDSAFGNSLWPIFHGRLSVFRAIENRRSFVFVNNTGGNLVVDPWGRIQAQGSVFTVGSVSGSVLLSTYQTPFTQWGGRILIGFMVALGAFPLCRWILFRWIRCRPR